MKNYLLVLFCWLSVGQLSAQNYAEPVPSPDGKQLAFISDRDGNNDLYIANIDGMDAHKIVALPGYDTHPRWSPDGTKILFNSFPDSGEKAHDVFIINVDGSGLVNLTNGKYPDGQADDWSMDGRRLYFSSGKYPGINLFSCKPDGSDVQQLTHETDKVCYFASSSPKDGMVVMAVFAKQGRGVYTMAKDGVLKLLKAGGDAPSWSPTGNKIAFQEKINGEYYLHLMNPDGSQAGPILGKEIIGQAPAWLPDGTKIFYETKNGKGEMGIHLLDLKSGSSSQILPKKTDDLSYPEAICHHIEVLASDEFEGRKPGTPGETKTIQYIKNQFEEIGLQPAAEDGTYFQKISLADFSTIAPSNLEIVGKKESLKWQLKKDFVIASQKAMELERIPATPFVFAGFGIYAPEIGWDDYKNVDVKGKIVIVLSGSPDEYTEDSTLWKGDPAANLYGQNFYKKNEAEARGALGLFTIYKQKPHVPWNWESLGNSYGQNKTAIKRELTERQLSFDGLITSQAINQLLNLAGLADFDFQKKALSTGFQAVELPVQTAFSFSNTWKDLPTYNVVGLLPGTSRADEAILYTAHWDHVGIGPAIAGDSIRNGAVDNASGTAAIIEIARAYKALPQPPKRSILFMATGAEEMGLLGAVWYARRPLFPLGKTVAALNMDSHFPYGKTKYVTGVVYGRSELDGYLEEAARLQGRVLIPNTEQNISQNIFFRSDHFPLAEVGVPSEFAVGFGGIDSVAWDEKASNYMPKYHQPNDEYSPDDDCAGIWQDAELIFLTGQMLDREDFFPMWDKEQPFQRLREKAHFESKYFRDVTATHLPVMSLLGRSMDAEPADLDGDGDLDIVVANEHNFNILLINDGTGHFTEESQKRLPLKQHDSEDIAIADFDGDGDLDLVFVCEDDQVNEFYENDGKGFFKDISYKIPVTGTSNAVVSSDLNGDGSPDLLIGNAPDRQGSGGQNFCLINDGNGNWKDETAQRLPVSTKATQDFELGDVDGDGDLDLFVANEDDSELLINDGNGFFKNETVARLPIEPGQWETREADFGDVDGDGDLDLFLANVNFRQTKDHQNRLFLNDGNGYFKDVTKDHLPVEKMHTVDGKFYDLDGDGDLDLITGNGFGNSYMAYFCESGFFKGDSNAVIPASVRGDGMDIEMADFNGDGVPDLYLCNFRGNDFLLFGK